MSSPLGGKRKRPSSELDPDTDSDSEWEYEYHPTETETFYVTLDLSAAPSNCNKITSYASFARVHEQAAKNVAEEEAEPSASQKDASSLIRDTVRDGLSASDLAVATPSLVVASEGGTAGAKEDEDYDKLQLLDLATDEPLVSYQGEVFRCEWRETLGSDLVFAAPENVPDSVQPLAKDPEGKWVLVTRSETTLLGVPLELRRRQGKKAGDGDIGENANIGEGRGEKEGEVTGRGDGESEQPFTVLMDPGTAGVRAEQASFLEQFMAIKQAKGETDTVYIGRGKSFMDEEGNVRPGPLLPRDTRDAIWEGMRDKEHEEAQDDDEADNDSAEGEEYTEEEDGDDGRDPEQEITGYDPTLLDPDEAPPPEKSPQNLALPGDPRRFTSAGAEPSPQTPSVKRTPNISARRSPMFRLEHQKESSEGSLLDETQRFPAVKVAKRKGRYHGSIVRGGGLFRDHNIVEEKVTGGLDRHPKVVMLEGNPEQANQRNPRVEANVESLQDTQGGNHDENMLDA